MENNWLNSSTRLVKIQTLEHWETTMSKNWPDNVRAAGFPILSSVFQIQGTALLAGVQEYRGVGRSELPFQHSVHQIPTEIMTEERTGALCSLTFWAQGLLSGQPLGAAWEVLSSTRPVCPVQYDSISLPQALPCLSTPPMLVFSCPSSYLLNTLFLPFFAKSDCTQCSEFGLTATSSGK